MTMPDGPATRDRLPDCFRDIEVLGAGVRALRETPGHDSLRLQAAVRAMLAAAREPAVEAVCDETPAGLDLFELRLEANRLGLHYLLSSTAGDIARGLASERRRRERLAASSRIEALDTVAGLVADEIADLDDGQPSIWDTLPTGPAGARDAAAKPRDEERATRHEETPVWGEETAMWDEAAAVWAEASVAWTETAAAWNASASEMPTTFEQPQTETIDTITVHYGPAAKLSETTAGAETGSRAAEHATSELQARRAELLARAGTTFAELRRRRWAGELTAPELAVWEELAEIEFLLA